MDRMDLMDGMDPEREALHRGRAASVVNGAGAASAGHVTR